jgi:hypothetical protein
MSLSVILAIFLLIFLWIALAKPDRLARFWSFPSKQKTNKYPTIEDIRRKYPKRLSQEQLRKQARAKDEAEAKRKQAIIDRNIKEIKANQEGQSLEQRRAAYDRDLANRMRAKGMSQAVPQRRNVDSPKYKKLLAMLNGDRATADRLISAYGIERAISDLERDRR